MQTMNPTVMASGRGGGELRRGTKRDAGDSGLSDIERFEKRLRMLSIRNEDHTSKPKFRTRPAQHASIAATITHARPQESPEEELMHVDDTRDRVYIHDLDAELADDESDEAEERLIFLPDIEKKLSRLPQQVLAEPEESKHGNQELVLYTLPQPSRPDEGQDAVRRMIEEVRGRAREKAVRLARQRDEDGTHGQSNGYHDIGSPLHRRDEPLDFDPDAMDIG